MLVTIAQFFLSLSILVTLHELGHFSAARWFKTRVEKFYLFFNPGFSLFKKQIGETEYGVGWLPLGGYVKISGMIDESMDTEQMKGEPQPWEFRSKPAWQRLIIMVAGVFVNFVLGIFLFSMVLWIWGQDYVPNENLVDGIGVGELGTELGLQDGDKILQIGSTAFDRFSQGALVKELVINEASTIKVNREGQEKLLNVPPAVVAKLTTQEYKDATIILPRYPYEISKVTGKPGKTAGIKKGDVITGLNGQPISFAHEFQKAKSPFTGQETIELQVNRGGQILTMPITLDEGMIGIQAEPLDKFIKMGKDEFSFGESIPAGWHKSVDFLGTQIKAFGQMFSGKIKAKDNLGSFITIGSMFGPDWDWRRFWSLTASLSLILAFINLLPIPALDGGYVMFLFIEILIGRKIPDRVMEITTTVGFFLLMALMIYAFGIDLDRWWSNR